RFFLHLHGTPPPHPHHNTPRGINPAPLASGRSVRSASGRGGAVRVPRRGRLSVGALEGPARAGGAAGRERVGCLSPAERPHGYPLGYLTARRVTLYGR